MTDLEIIDEIAMRYEAQWQPTAKIRSIISFLEEQAVSDENMISALPELVMIDMDRRWKQFNSWVSCGVLADEALSKLCEIPRPQNYLSCFEDWKLKLSQNATQEIRDYELLARARFGDLPAPESGDAVTIVRKLQPYRPEIIVRYCEDEVYRVQTWGGLTLGRQDRHEPEPYCIRSEGCVLKLICADSQKKRISRHQARIQLLTPKFAVLQNTSRNRFFLANGALGIEPGQSEIMSLPFSLQLDEVSVSLSPNAA